MFPVVRMDYYPSQMAYSYRRVITNKTTETENKKQSSPERQKLRRRGIQQGSFSLSDLIQVI